MATIADAKKMCEINLKNLPENYSLLQWNFLIGTGPFSFVAETETGEMVGYCLAITLWPEKVPRGAHEKAKNEKRITPKGRKMFPGFI